MTMKAVKDKFPPISQEKEAYVEQQLQKAIQHPKVHQFLLDYKDVVNRQIIKESLGQILSFIHDDDYYTTHGTSKILAGYAPTLEWANGRIEMGYKKTQQTLQKEAHEKLQKRVTYIDIPKSVRTASFDQIDIESNPSLMDVMETLMHFASTYDLKHFQKGIYLYGKFGIGKTYIMGALANELAKRNIETTLVNTATFISQLKQTFNQPESNAEVLINKIKRTPVLVLDDIGMETISEWSRDDVLGVILQYRMQEELPTFFTSNLSMQALEKHLAETKQATNELRAKRLMERIKYLAKEVELDRTYKR